MSTPKRTVPSPRSRLPSANNTPASRTVSDFRKDYLEALGDPFLRVLELCQQAGLVKLGYVALDGGKVRAHATRHKAMSYGRMKEREGQFAAEVAELLRRAGEVDDDEDSRYGKDKRGDELPKELAFRESRLRRIREAKAEGRNHPGVPDDKAQRNFTDPNARIMPGPGGRDFQQSYNCHAVVDSAHQVITPPQWPNISAPLTSDPTNVLRDRVHAVIAADDGKVDPQGDLDVGVAQPGADHIERHPAGHQPMPGGTVPQAVSAGAPMPGPRRLLTQARGLDPAPMCRSAVRMLSDTTLSRGDRLAGQFVNSCTSSGCRRTVRALRVFDLRTSSVAGSPV